jgi:hypothetical protein
MNKKILNTSQRLQHVYGCTGQTMHITTGTAILQHGEMKCPTCNAPVQDITNTPVGKSYFAFGRPDLGARPQ